MKRRLKKGKNSEIDKEKYRATVIKLVVLIIAVAAIFAFYRLMLSTPVFPYVFWVYAIALVALLFIYILYNRGVSRKSLTEDMLPSEWSYEMKMEYIEEAEHRLNRTEWMLMVIMGLLFTFAFEFLELFVLPWLEKLLG